jgi:uridine phosphorylase
MTHHLGDVQTSATTAIVTGDPDRVPTLAAAAGSVLAMWSRRGYVGAEVDAGADRVIVCSTGIGGPTAAIVVEELAQLGVRQIVRVGTCGSMQPQVRAGDFVVATASVRDDGTSGQYLPVAFPAVGDPELLAAIESSLRDRGNTCHVGVTHSKDAYYAESASGMPMASWWEQRWAMLRAAGVLATEMEIATLYVVAMVRGLRAAAVVVPVDESLGPEQTLAALAEATSAVVGAAIRADRRQAAPRAPA